MWRSAVLLLLHERTIRIRLPPLGSLVKKQRHGFCLLRLGHQHCVAAQHHGLVLHLVPVNPSENLGYKLDISIREAMIVFSYSKITFIVITVKAIKIYFLCIKCINISQVRLNICVLT
uniref:Uncharacterized protein n=1 Tax=Seriola dumerili TaxID=41447 RepID=A0A3B4TJN2_SERDU